jgi:CheY-like chemotaxis protein
MTKAEEKTILVVEDEPDVRVFLQTVLEDAGFRVLTAADGDAAWTLIQEVRPDFISLDLILPKRSGHRLLKDLRQDSELKRIPVLIVTAHAEDDLGRSDPEDILNRVIAEGPGRLLQKPVKPIDFVRCVQTALGVDEGEDVEAKLLLKDQMRKMMAGADSDSLRSAMEALKKKA